MKSTIKEIKSLQQDYFYQGKTLGLKERLKQLSAVEKVIKAHEKELIKAVHEDLRKSNQEIYTTEMGFIYHELRVLLNKLSWWMKPQMVSGSLGTFPGKCRIKHEPLGNSLVISPWNYPLLLAINPLVSSIGAGNTVILKPSEYSPNTSARIEKMINENFDPGLMHVFTGGVECSSQLLSEPFDKIFFTGSSRVGKIVAKAAAENLSSCTLELGGKNPVIIAKDANLKVAAKRIVYGKFLNSGQTCIAPDHLFVHESIMDEFLKLLVRYIKKFYAEKNGAIKSLPIATKANYLRLKSMINKDELYWGGGSSDEDCCIEPTILYPVNRNSLCMEDEIFGPVLPVFPFNDYYELIQELKIKDKALSSYLFTNSNKLQKHWMENLSFGGGAVNETLIHFANSGLPFGGVGNSGMGKYHGIHGFKEFSHAKSLVKRSNYFDFFIKYPPDKKYKEKLIRKFLR